MFVSPAPVFALPSGAQPVVFAVLVFVSFFHQPVVIGPHRHGHQELSTRY